MRDSVTWKVAGEAGFGIMASGNMFARAFSHLGYHVFVTNEYPSLIRGGNNLVTVRVSTKKFHSMNRDLHILTALNKETVELYKHDLSDGSIVVFDPKDYQWKPEEFDKKVTLIGVPLSDIVAQHKGIIVMRNTVAIGATVALVGADFEVLSSIIHEQFKKKKQEIIDQNISLAKAGYDYVKNQSGLSSEMYLEKPTTNEKLLVINASEAVGVGAIRAGLKFAAIYPMTPINALITFLADHEKKFGIVYKQPEDEIAGIMMALGASFGGVRSMVATSGGGFALMVEGVSCAGIMELPVVINVGMRVGPATGMPTWTEQGELQFVIHAGHGEFSRVVLAPGDGGEAYIYSKLAFHLADKYHIPVFILTDKYLNESHWCVPEAHFKGDVKVERGKLILSGPLASDGSYKRYDTNTDDGVSPRSVPGVEFGAYYSNSYEHDGIGFVTEKANDRIAMVEKRAKKMAKLIEEVQAPTRYGDENADITLFCWGSNKGPAIDAMEMLKTKGVSVNVYHFGWVYPFPSGAVTDIVSKSKRIIDVESNSTAQLASLIREFTGFEIKEKFCKYNGRPFYPEEIVERIVKG